MEKIFNLAIDGVYEMFINEKIDSWTAQSISYQIANLDAKKFRMRINSFGGNVIAGYGIVSAMQMYKNQGGEIEVINEGVADSAAGWIAMCGTKGQRKGFNYSTYLVHGLKNTDGSPVDESNPEMMLIKNGIVGIISDNTGMSKDQVEPLLEGENRFSFEDAQNMGIVDEMINSKNKVVVNSSTSVKEIYNMTKNINYKPEIKQMKQLAGVMGLSNEASESAFIDAFNATKSDLDAAKAEVERLKNVNATFSKKLDEIQEREIENYVSGLVKENKISEDKKEEAISLCNELGFESAQKFYSTINVVVNATKIDEGIKEGNKERDVFEKAKNFLNGSDSSDEAKAAFFENETNEDFKTYLANG